jgi:hypothetical protein
LGYHLGICTLEIVALASIGFEIGKISRAGTGLLKIQLTV